MNDKQKAANYETLKHIEIVMQLLATMQHEISRRMFTHDRSKLESPEREMFEQFTDRLAGLTYGSDEYKACLEEMKQVALLHHYENNRHHPEFFGEQPQVAEELKRCDRSIAMLKGLAEDRSDEIFAYEIEVLERHRRSLVSGVNSMNLIDVVEMLCDWKAATLRHKDGDIHKSLAINSDRFGLSPQLVNILENSLPLLRSVYGGEATQKDLH